MDDWFSPQAWVLAFLQAGTVSSSSTLRGFFTVYTTPQALIRVSGIHKQKLQYQYLKQSNKIHLRHTQFKCLCPKPQLDMLSNQPASTHSREATCKGRSLGFSALQWRNYWGKYNGGCRIIANQGLQGLRNCRDTKPQKTRLSQFNNHRRTCSRSTVKSISEPNILFLKKY